MVVVVLLLAGWIGLFAALLGQVFTGADLSHFLTTWMLAGYASLAAMALIAATWRLRSVTAPQHA